MPQRYLETLSTPAPRRGRPYSLRLSGLCRPLQRWLRRHDAFVRGLGLGILTGIFALLVHSLMDFNLRIPATPPLRLSLCARFPACSPSSIAELLAS